MPWHRRSVRRWEGAYGDSYLVTLCTYRRRAFLVEVGDEARGGCVGPHGSRLRGLVEECWLAIPIHHPHVSLGPFTIQADHMHGILHVGRPNGNGRWVGSDLRVGIRRKGSVGSFGHLVPGALPVVVRSFKGAVTREAGRRVWQRGYHERILRDCVQEAAAAAYIENHPDFVWNGA